MYDGYKEDWVGGLTDKLVDGHEKLAGFGEKRGAGGLEGSDLRWRRVTTRATTGGLCEGATTLLGSAVRLSSPLREARRRLCCGGLPMWGVLPAYGGRYSPARPSCGVLGCPTEHLTPRTPIAMTTLIKTFWLKSIRSHNGYGTPKGLFTATLTLRAYLSPSPSLS